MRHTFTLILIAGVLLAGCSREGADWTAAQSANTIESYQEFLRQHPDSAHGLQAQASVNQLTEDRDWQQAAAADTREAYEGFVAAHADSKWAQEARVRVENLALGGSSTAAQPAAAGSEADAGATVPGSTAAPAAASPTTTKPTPAPAAARPAAPVATKPAAKPAPAAAAASAPAAKGSQLVQFGAFSTRERAEAQWKTLLAKESQLKSLEPRYASGSANGKKLYRLQASLASPAKARELCAALKAQSQSCLLVQR